MQTLSSTELSQVLAVPVPTVQSWARRDIIRPVVPGRGTGNHARYAIVDVLAVALARGLRARGVPLKMASMALDVLRGYTEAELCQAFEEGRRYIVLTQDGAHGGLVGREQVFGQSTDQAQEDGLLPVVVDVKVFYDRVCSKIDGLNRNGTEAATAGRV